MADIKLKTVVVVKNDRCLALKPDAEGTYRNGDYEYAPSTGMISDGFDAWDVTPTAYKLVDAHTLYIKLMSDGNTRSVTSTTTNQSQYYNIICDNPNSLKNRLMAEMKRTYDNMDKMDISLPSEDSCFVAYQKRFELAEKMMKAVTLGQMDYIQNTLGLSDADFSAANVIDGFKTYLLPPYCAAENRVSVPPSAPSKPVGDTKVSAPEPTQSTASVDTKKMQAAIGSISVATAINNARERSEARANGETVSPTTAKLLSTPHMIPIQSIYTQWAVFGLSAMNPDRDLQDVTKRLIKKIAAAAEEHSLTHGQFRVILISQHAADNIKTEVNAASSAIQKADIKTVVLHQMKPIYRIDDLLASNGRLSSSIEKLVNSIVVAVVPSNVPHSNEELLGYYSTFLNRLEGGMCMGSDAGTKVRTLDL